jgi:hypothetical protein
MIDQVHNYYDDIIKDWSYDVNTNKKPSENVKTSRTTLGKFFDKLFTPLKRVLERKDKKKKKKS